MPSRAWYGDIDLTLDFPAAWDVHTLGMKDAPALNEAQIEAAFANPIGTPPIHELAKGRKSATVIVDDVSRPTPASLLVPYVLRELTRAGVPKSEIRFVIGGGSHRAQTQEELEKKLGVETVANYAVKSHNFMAGDLKGIGTLEDGTPLYFDPWVVDADFKMTIGGIYPHGAVGFGGGSKLVLPGVAGFATMFHFHTFYASRGQGNIERTGPDPDHRDASEAAARALGLDLVVNTVINSRRQMAALFVGDFVKAQRAGAHFAQDIFGTEIPESLRSGADLVVVNAYPLDSDPIQTGKALWCRRHFTNARFVVVNPAVDGICYHGLFDRIDWKRYSAQMAAREAIIDPVPQLGGIDQTIIWSENYPIHDFPRKHPNDLLVRKWETVLELVQPTLPERATVAVFPTSGLQLLARE
jgi:nickel-dependent lactate racemase